MFFNFPVSEIMIGAGGGGENLFFKDCSVQDIVQKQQEQSKTGRYLTEA